MRAMMSVVAITLTHNGRTKLASPTGFMIGATVARLPVMEVDEMNHPTTLAHTVMMISMLLASEDKRMCDLPRPPIEARKGIITT